MKRAVRVLAAAALLLGATLPSFASGVKKQPKEKGTIRILYWNIQMGMWADQEAQYANFRKWIKSYDPDICIWCECGSYKPSSGKGSIPKEDRYFPNGWKEFAKSYGHRYCAIGAVTDNFPQVVSSKYPLSTIQTLAETGTDRPVWHGAGHHRITIKGRTYDIVTTHPWPFAYSYENRKKSPARDSSAKARDGEKYRAFEMSCILQKTICNPEFAGTEWIFAGDMNSISRKDNSQYGYAADDIRFSTQDVIANSTDLVDAVFEKNGGKFTPSTAKGDRRIDYVYLSPSLYKQVTDARIITESWTPYRYTGISNYWIPSDHLPIVVDLKLK